MKITWFMCMIKIKNKYRLLKPNWNKSEKKNFKTHCVVNINIIYR